MLYLAENGRYDTNHVLYALNHAKHVSVIARYFLEIKEIVSAKKKVQHALLLTRSLLSI